MSKKEKQVGRNTDKTNDKAPYRSPHLVTYGDIRELTLTSKNAQTNDSKFKNKTG